MSSYHEREICINLRSWEVGNGNPLQYSCLENGMHRGAWGATVHRLTGHTDTPISTAGSTFTLLCGSCHEYWLQDFLWNWNSAPTQHCGPVLYPPPALALCSPFRLWAWRKVSYDVIMQHLFFASSISLSKMSSKSIRVVVPSEFPSF